MTGNLNYRGREVTEPTSVDATKNLMTRRMTKMRKRVKDRVRRSPAAASLKPTHRKKQVLITIKGIPTT